MGPGDETVDGAEQELTGEATDVLQVEEKARAAAFGRATAILSAMGLVVAAIRSLDRVERITVMVPVAFLGIVGALVWWRSRNVARYSSTLFRLFGLTSSLCSIALVYRLGVFTPIVAIIVLGLAFFVNTRDQLFAITTAGTVVVSYVVLGALVITHVLPDIGIWRIAVMQKQVSMLVVTASVMLIQIAVARANRRAFHRAIAQTQAAMRVIRTREAQLDEVRENLDVALRAGNEGRLTGKQLGPYSVGNVVGRGAMGEVYAARSEAHEKVAIKVLRAVDDDDIAQRFVREAEIAQKVRGPNLVEVRDTGRSAEGDLFIVMELLEGQDLAAMLRARTHLPLDEVVALVESTARGLALLHGAGVIHRDLKPQNLFLSSSSLSEWKILDYGVSKLVGAHTMTKGNLVGTPGYMSPEQAESGDVDARSDVFSLGAVAYRALTGRRPFGGADMPAILYQVVHGSPTRPREIVEGIPPALEDVLAKALAKKRDDRFATAIDFAIAFRRAAQPALGDQDEPTVTANTQARPSWSKIATGKTGKKKKPSWKSDPTTLTLPGGEQKR